MISDIIENAEYSMTGGEYYKQRVLEDGFIETEGIIKNWQYEFDFFSHLIAVNKNKAQSRKRIEISEVFLKKIKDLDNKQINAPLQWIAGPTQLAFIISMLVQNEYIKPPTTVTKNGVNKGKIKINYNQLSRDILAAFNMSEHNSIDTIRAYLNPESYKYVEVKKSFDSNGFVLPKRQI